MIKTKYISNCTSNDIDILKIAALYFDKVEIINNVLCQVEPVPDSEQNEEKTIVVIKGFTEFVNDDYKSHIKTLLDEEIVEIITEENKSEDELWGNIDKITNNILSNEYQIIFNESDLEYDDAGNKIGSKLSLSDEAKIIHEEFVGPLKIGSFLNLGFLIKYYSSLLSSMLLHVAKGEQCLTSSDILNKFLGFYAKNNKTNKLHQELKHEDVNPNLIMNAIQLAVPNISSFPFEEVLETREKANSELLKFRDELEQFQFNLQENYSLEEINFKAAEIVKYKLNPSIKDLKRKVETLNLSVPKIMMDEFRDPLTYTPLLGSIMGGIPAHLATLLSLGIISVSSAYEYILRRKEIKNNGLYYLIKLNNQFQKKNDTQQGI
jgi:hypothetical protein